MRFLLRLLSAPLRVLTRLLSAIRSVFIRPRAQRPLLPQHTRYAVPPAPPPSPFVPDITVSSAAEADDEASLYSYTDYSSLYSSGVGSSSSKAETVRPGLRHVDRGYDTSSDYTGSLVSSVLTVSPMAGVTVEQAAVGSWQVASDGEEYIYGFSGQADGGRRACSVR